MIGPLLADRIGNAERKIQPLAAESGPDVIIDASSSSVPLDTL